MIDIIYRIIYDIGWFSLVLVLMSSAFSYSLYIISKSQSDFDNIQDFEMSGTGIPYGTISGSFFYLWDLLIGNFNTKPFDLGDRTQRLYLYTVYCVCVFIFMIHLMNMLIAIMGNTYAIRNEVIDLVKYQDHLKFVLDNWFLLNSAFKDTKKLNYIVAAFGMNHQVEDDDNQIAQVKGEISQKLNIVAENQHRNSFKMREVNLTVQNLMRLQTLGPGQYEKVRKKLTDVK